MELGELIVEGIRDTTIEDRIESEVSLLLTHETWRMVDPMKDSHPIWEYFYQHREDVFESR